AFQCNRRFFLPSSLREIFRLRFGKTDFRSRAKIQPFAASGLQVQSHKHTGENIMTETPAAQPTPEAILQVGLAFWGSKTLLSAIELDVFTELARHPLSLADLQARLGLHPRSARDFFDALVSMGFLQREGGTYRNTPATDLYLDKYKPTYIGGVLEMCNHRLYPL